MRFNLATACVFAAICVIDPARADDFTWTPINLNDVTWDSANGNWSLNGVSTSLIPDADDNVFIDLNQISSVFRSLDLNGDRQVQSLTLSGTDAPLGGVGIEGIIIIDTADTLSLGTGDLNASLDSSFRFDTHVIATDVLLLDDGVWDISERTSGGAILYIRGEIRDRSGAFDLDQFNLTKTGGGTLEVSDVDIHGDLIVEGGVLSIPSVNLVSNNNGLIGDAPGTNGAVNISRSGASWTNSNDLIVGDEGTGTLLIENGGAVSNKKGFIAESSGSIGTVTVTGAGSTWTNNGVLIIGEEGEGTLLVEDGGVVTTFGTAIGDASAADAHATVSGSGSTLSNGQILIVGNNGTASLLIEDGGEVLSGIMIDIGSSGGSTGEITVTGAGSSLSSGTELSLGDAGNGTLLIENGGTVKATRLTIGESASGVGAATVRGAGSSLTTPLELRVGGRGTGTLLIEDGATATSRDTLIGQTTADSIGTVAVTGADSTWITSRSVYVGGSAALARGTGTVTISDSALTSVGDTLTIWDDGTVNLAGGTLTADTIDHTQRRRV